MSPPGFIHGKLDIKLLVLYIMTRTVAPIDFPAMTDLAMCDDGVDYFLFAQGVAELVDSGHLSLSDGLYSITDKGRRNSADTETSLAAAVRAKCNHATDRLNAALRRDAQVRAEVASEPAGGVRLHLAFDDNEENLLSVSLLAASEEQALRMGRRFRAHPNELYNGVLELLQRED